MPEMTNTDQWLHKAASRLQSDSFVVLPEQSYRAAGFRFAVRRSRFEITKFGMAETFYTFADISELTPQKMASFSDAAFRFAVKSEVVPLPAGLIGSVWSFAVAITNNVDLETVKAIQNNAPAKHWSAGEMPAIYDASTGFLGCFEGPPIWGAAYFDGFRRQIRTYLGP